MILHNVTAITIVKKALRVSFAAFFRVIPAQKKSGDTY